MSRFKLCLLSLVTLGCLACIAHAVGRLVQDDAPAPLEIGFESAIGTLFGNDFGVPSCGVPPDREQCYDPRTGVFHIRFKEGAQAEYAFTMTKVAERFTKPVVFRLTGVPLENGCLGRKLTLTADGKEYELEHDFRGVGETLFRVKREKGGAVVVAVTKEGEAILKTGTKIWFSVDSAW